MSKNTYGKMAKTSIASIPLPRKPPTGVGPEKPFNLWRNGGMEELKKKDVSWGTPHAPTPKQWHPTGKGVKV